MERAQADIRLQIECDREDDGRWIAEVPELPGVLAYGATQAAAMRAVYTLALRVIADRVEHHVSIPPQFVPA